MLACLALACAALAAPAAAAAETAPTITEPTAFQTVPSPVSVSGTAEVIDSVTLDVWEGSSASGSPAGSQFVLNVGSWSTQLTLPPGTYTIVAVANGTEETRSEPVTFFVPEPEVAPKVTSNPQNQTVTEGESASFSASATGNPAPSVEWEYSTNGGGTWESAGSSSTTLTISPTNTGENGWKFRARFTNGKGSVTSGVAELRVNELTVAPEVTSDPQSVSVTAGESASFSASASGTPAPSVEWQVSTDGGGSWSAAGGSSGTFKLNTTNTGENGWLFRAVFRNSAGKATTSAAELSVAAQQFAPIVESNPGSRSVKAGESASFSASASGNPTPSVQWEVSTDSGGSWSPIGGANSDTFNTGPTNTGENGFQYRAVFSNSKGTVASSAATLEVVQGPEITGNPGNVQVEAGGPASFSASANGNPAPSVQWQVSTNGGGSWGSISGANSTTFTIASTTPGENGNQYRAVFHNGSGTVTSAPARLEVLYGPSIAGNPSSRVVTEPESVSFTATAAGNPSPSVQWEVSENEGATWAPDAEPSATSTTLKISTTNVEQSGNQYRAVFSNGVGAPAISNVAVLTVHERKVAPKITEQPENQIVKEGETAVFRADATGVPPPSIQWEVSTNGGVSWGPDSDPDAKSPTLVLASVPLAHSGYRYRATFSNGVSPSAVTSVAVLEVSAKTQPPHIKLSPVSKEVEEGALAEFKAEQEGGTGTVAVQWELSANHGGTWAAIAGAITPTFKIPKVKPTENEDEYRATFTNTVGSATSAPATLTVLSQPKLTLGPVAPVAEGEDATFTATATGVPAPTIQWEYAPSGSSSFKKGPTGPEFVIPNVTEGLNGLQIKAVASNKVGKVEATATLEVTNSPTVKTSPGNVIADAGSAAVFTATASGSPPPSEVEWEVKVPGSASWVRDTTDAPAKTVEKTKVTASLTVASVSPADNGDEYRALFKRSGASPAISEAGRLTIHLGPTVTTQPSSVTVAPGGQATFTAAASGLPAPTVQWEMSTDGGATFAPIEGATSDTLTLPSVSSADSGHSFRAVFSNGVGEPAVSNAAVLTVGGAAPTGPVASFTWLPHSPAVGEPVSLASTSTDASSGIAGYAWDLGGTGTFTAGGPVIGTVFTTPGPHHIGLRVSTADGRTASVTETIEVLPAQYSLMRPFPVVRIAGVDNGIGAKITLLSVQAPLGAKISVSCKGHGCPAKKAVAMASAPPHHHHGSTVTVVFKRFERQLRAGVVLQIRVSKAGVIGKYTSFTIRRSKQPLRIDACLDAVSGAKAIKCPI